MSVFYSVLFDLEIQQYLFKTEYTAKEMQWREAAAGGDHPQPQLPRANAGWWCLHSNCPPMPRETKTEPCVYITNES